MSLKEILNNDIKSAMKAKDKETLAVLRMIKTAVQAAEIDKKEELNVEEELTILAREAKQRRESLAEFVKAGRDELVAKTETEIEIVERYLPKQLSVEEVKEVIATVAEKIGATTQKEFGKLMGAVMQELKGKENVVLFCRRGIRAGKAQDILKKHNIAAVNGKTVEHIKSLQKVNLADKLTFRNDKQTTYFVKDGQNKHENL